MSVSSVASQGSVAPTSQLSHSFGGVLKKITAAVCGYLLLSGGGAQAVSVKSFSLEGRVQGGAPEGATQISDGLALFHKPGEVATEKGSGYCSIEGIVPGDLQCAQAVSDMGVMVRGNQPDVWRAYSTTSKDTRETGVPAKFQGNPSFGDLGVRFLANPALVDNARKVYQLLGKEILAEPESFFAKSEEDLLGFLKTMQKMFCKNNQNVQGQDGRPGKLRIAGVFVTEQRGGEEPAKYLVNALSEKGGTQAELQTLLGIFRKMQKYGTYDDALKKLTAEEKRVFGKVAFIPTAPEKVKEEMLSFLREFKAQGAKVLSGEVDALSVAAWVHQEIGRIHPFEDHNGHTARALMQAIMRLGGYPEIVFPDDDEYTAAVVEDQKNPGAFVSYLNGMLQWNKAHKAELIEYGLEAPGDLVVAGKPVDLVSTSSYKVGTAV